MRAPRLEIDLAKIQRNAQTLVGRLANRGISVMGVTKAALGSPDIAKALLGAGVASLGDSRIENIETMRRAGLSASMALVRSPMLSQVERVVAFTDLSFNTELDVMRALSLAARRAKKTHRVVLMVELGDLREGIMPRDLERTVRATLDLPNIALVGIGTNLACRSGVAPDERNMAELSGLADSIDETFGPVIRMVSGGNSGNLPWVLNGAETGRVNHLRLGESILLGREPLHRGTVDGLQTDAFVLIAEVIESKRKPSMPAGDLGQAAFGSRARNRDRGELWQVILAVGHQDTDPFGLDPPPGFDLLGASSDHLVLASPRGVSIGGELAFQPNYSALLRAMTSPFVSKVWRADLGATGSPRRPKPSSSLTEATRRPSRGGEENEPTGVRPRA